MTTSPLDAARAVAAQTPNPQPGTWAAHLHAALTEVDRLRNELAETESDVALLRALEAFGVDNWEGYDDAIESVES